jgi:two-component system LytT family response regulator
MKILIVDDEPGIRDGLIQLLNSFCPEVSEIAEASGVEEGVAKMRSFQPDLLFTDVEMGDGTGFDLLEKIAPVGIPVIFITAHNKYAVNAFKFCAIDFLEKPIDVEDLIIALGKVNDELSARDIKLQFESLREFMGNQNTEDKKIVLRDSKNIFFVKISEILHCVASGSYTDFHLLDGRKITVSKPLKEYEQMLTPFNFIRTHNSHLVNIKQISRLDKTEGGSVVLENGESIPISQRKWEQVLKLLGV